MLTTQQAISCIEHLAVTCLSNGTFKTFQDAAIINEAVQLIKSNLLKNGNETTGTGQAGQNNRSDNKGVAAGGIDSGPIQQQKAPRAPRKKKIPVASGLQAVGSENGSANGTGDGTADGSINKLPFGE
jgi:hypothetical protein